jgi:hypothetical protein
LVGTRAGVEEGISRRRLLKRGAVVGAAAVWAPPVIDSFSRAASALPGSPRDDSISYVALVYKRSNTKYILKFEVINTASVSCVQLVKRNGEWLGLPGLTPALTGAGSCPISLKGVNNSGPCTLWDNNQAGDGHAKYDAVTGNVLLKLPSNTTILDAVVKCGEGLPTPCKKITDPPTNAQGYKVFSGCKTS